MLPPPLSFSLLMEKHTLDKSAAILEIEVSKHLVAACTTCTTVLLVVPILIDPIPRVSVWQLAPLASLAR